MRYGTIALSVSLCAAVILGGTGEGRAQAWVATAQLASGSPASCPDIQLPVELTLSGDELAVKSAVGQGQGKVAADGAVALEIKSPVVSVGSFTISGNARARSLRAVSSGQPDCAYTLVAGNAPNLIELSACGRNLSFAVEPPGPNTPAGLAAFSGMWVGNRGGLCAGAIFESVSDPDKVRVLNFNGRWSNISASHWRTVGKFHSGNRIWFVSREYTFEYILGRSGEMTTNSTGWQTLSGTLKRQQ